MAGLYIHIPYCRSKCGYCDFYSVAEPVNADALVRAMMREMECERSFTGRAPLQTIYFGGGTPSLLPPAALHELIAHARELWGSTAREITVEANPDDLSAAYLAELARAGVDRLSIGIQSFVDDHLRFMNRRHDAASAVDAVRSAREAGFRNISIDLIYGIPGMSEGQWHSNLKKAVALAPEHISAYHLTLEPGTPFGLRAASGALHPVDDTISERQYRHLHELLTEAGYEHYEVSNFAKRGRRSLHNSSYWNGSPYLGIGPSAHSFDGERTRRWSAATLGQYLEGPAAKYYRTETLTDDDRYNEYVMTSLRTADGADIEHLARHYGGRYAEHFLLAAEGLLRAGYIVKEGGKYIIPPPMWLVSDTIIGKLFIDTD